MRYRYSIYGGIRPEGRGLITSEVVNLSVSTYKRAAYLAIRDMIVELEIPPGARLVETDLAARLNVSKTPIREAIAARYGVEVAGESLSSMLTKLCAEQALTDNGFTWTLTPAKAELKTAEA